MQHKEFNVLSLFDGMSCGQIALNKLGIEYSNYFASEIKHDAIQVTQNSYPNTIQLGDVTKIDVSNLPKIDLLIGGSPCQDFSQANKNKLGLEGEKSKLFYEYLRLLKECNPQYFLLENVKMKKDWEDIITKELGVNPIRINSKLITGQLRERVYWTNIPFIGNLNDKGILLKDILDFGYTDREKARCLLEGDSRPTTTPVKIFHRYYNTGFTTVVFKNQQHFLDCKIHYDTNFKGKSAKEIHNESKVYDGIRFLNQNELEKLQTVPIGYTKILTRNQAAGVLGDGWTVDVICELLKGLKIN